MAAANNVERPTTPQRREILAPDESIPQVSVLSSGPAVLRHQRPSRLPPLENSPQNMHIFRQNSQSVLRSPLINSHMQPALSQSHGRRPRAVDSVEEIASNVVSEIIGQVVEEQLGGAARREERGARQPLEEEKVAEDGPFSGSSIRPRSSLVRGSS